MVNCVLKFIMIVCVFTVETMIAETIEKTAPSLPMTMTYKKNGQIISKTRCESIGVPKQNYEQTHVFKKAVEGAIQKNYYADIYTMKMAQAAGESTLKLALAEEEGIADNSPNVEEAFQQPYGVVQFINKYQRMNNGDWAYVFTAEFPAPNETHQLSFSIPILKNISEDADVGDISVDYRYALVNNDGLLISPRFSLLLPSGDYRLGSGSGALGYQGNIPVTKVWNHKWVTHTNLGYTYIPNAREAGGKRADSSAINYGQSVVYLMGKRINIMAEVFGRTFDEIQTDGSVTQEKELFGTLGCRGSIDFKDGWNFVPGIYRQIGFGPSQGENGWIFYSSFEKKFW